MLKHIVMSKLKEKADGRSRDENAIILKRKLEDLRDKIPDILEMEVGINAIDSPTAYDVVLIVTFADMEGLSRYLKHPEHASVVEFLAIVRSGRCVVDYFA